MLDGIQAIHSLSGNVDSTGAVGDFVRFPKLPPELRREIWKLALPGTRIIEVTSEDDYYSRERGYRKLRLSCDMPVLMHVCRESRQVALEKYTVNLAGERFPNDCARIDPREDTIFIPLREDSLLSMEQLSKEALSTIQFLAIDHQMWNGTVWAGTTVFEDFTVFAALKDLYIVHDEAMGLPDCPCEECREESLSGKAVDTSLEELDDPEDYGYDEDAMDEIYARLESLMEEHKKPEWKLPEVTIMEVERAERRVHRKYWGY